MEATEKQINTLDSLLKRNYITQKQYDKALNSKSFASKVIDFGIKKNNRAYNSGPISGKSLSLEQYQDIMRFQGVHVGFYNGRRVSQFTKPWDKRCI